MAKVLIIDDEEQMRGVIRQMLERAGHEVLEAEDGGRGMEVFRGSAVDLVITDILMPEKEGLETIMEMKREAPDTRIIAISGGGRAGTLNFLPAAEKLGASAILAKPFKGEELIKAVNDLLGRDSQA